MGAQAIHNMSPNLILAGFMGTGKSTVGRLCAQQLGLQFVDTDVEIVRREGMSIPHMFQARGEDYFRQREHELVNELTEWGGCVIATGGGMSVNDDNRNLLLASGVGVCLTATPDVIVQRVGDRVLLVVLPKARRAERPARASARSGCGGRSRSTCAAARPGAPARGRSGARTRRRGR